MSLFMSPQMITILEKNLANTKPLQGGEVRRISGLGELYATLPETIPTEPGYQFHFQYSAEVAGTKYNFYAREPAPAK